MGKIFVAAVTVFISLLPYLVLGWFRAVLEVEVVSSKGS